MKAKFYKLVAANYHIGFESEYNDFDIIDEKTGEQLDMVCAKMLDDRFDPVSGAVGLLHSDEHEGYCQLYYTYRKKDEDSTVTIDFTPAYTNNGEIILIKTNVECPFCSVGSKFDYDRETYKTTERSYLTYFLKWSV